MSQVEQGGEHPTRLIGLGSALALVAGSMLGIGIFLAPVTMAQHLNSVGVFFGVWVFTGLIALAGAMAYAELGVRMPHSGGDYVFQREALGPSVAFAYGWGLLSAGFAGSIAAMAVPLCTYQLGALTGHNMSVVVLSLPLIGDLQGAQLAALTLIWALTLINVYGVRWATALQSLTTYLPLLALLGLSVYVWSQPAYVVPVVEASSSALNAGVQGAIEGWSVGGLTTAFLEAYFAYSGWNAVIYVAGEVERPSVTLPRALVGGTLVVMSLYLIFCSAALHGLSLEGLRALGETRQDVGSALAAHLGGGLTLTLTLTFIAVALVASINATILGGGRVGLALARDGAFWRGAARLHPTHHTPANALYAQALIATLAVLFVPWYLIFSVVSLVLVVGGALTVLSLLLLKRRSWRLKSGEDMSAEGYQAWGSPWLPALFIGAALFVLVVKLLDVVRGVEGAWYPVAGLGVVLVAYLAHKLTNTPLTSPSQMR